MGKKGVVAAVVIVGLAFAVLPAGAAQGPTITASNFRFSPPALSITSGQTVTFANVSGAHNFAFDDGTQIPADPALDTDPVWDQPPTRTFTQAGVYRFRCEAHPDQMQGEIAVNGGDPTPTPTATPIPTPTPTPTPTPPGGGGGGGPGPEPTDPGGSGLEIRTLRLAASTFCVKRSRRCRRPGVRIRIDLSRRAEVAGTLRRAGRRFGTLDLGAVAAGPRTLRFTRTASGRRLAPGRYALSLRIDGDPFRTLRFRVRR